jgi:hypothetical protein
MAKKSRRGRGKRAVPQAGVERVSAQQPFATREAAVSASDNLAEEYGYVFSDLRRIAVIAAAMFVLLFALALVLR